MNRKGMSGWKGMKWKTSAQKEKTAQPNQRNKERTGKLSMEVHTCSPGTRVAEAGDREL